MDFQFSWEPYMNSLQLTKELLLRLGKTDLIHKELDCIILTDKPKNRPGHTYGTLARRLLQLYRPITDNSLWCCHTCDDNRCINVLHLYWGTASQNALDTRARHPIYNQTISGNEKQLGIVKIGKNIRKRKKGNQYD